jgi:hypothetical protein
MEPNIANSVANRASFTIDFRRPDKDVLLARGDAVAGGGARRVGAGNLPRSAGGMRATGDRRGGVAAAEQQYRHMRLPWVRATTRSSRFRPTGMAPCGNGISTIR